MSMVPTIRVTETFGASTKLKLALDGLLQQAARHHEDRHPDAKALSWSNIQVLAHQTNAKYFTLDRNQTLNGGSVHDFFELFRTRGYSSKAAILSREIELRFLYDWSEVFDEAGVFASASIQASASAGTRSKRRGSDVESSRPSSQRRTFKLVSAFRPRQEMQPYQRSPELRTIRFTRTIAERSPDGMVTLHPSSDVEELLIATDWIEGEQLAKEKKPYAHTGYIGEGYTKRAVYSRSVGKEYAFLTGRDGHTDTELRGYLEEEYRLLIQADMFCDAFFAYAKDCEVNLPRFRFNVEDAILGSVLPEDMSPAVLPYRHFLATKLLPCGEMDGQVVKFTGNGDIGEAHDDITKAIHAFVHFVLVYTRRTVLLCDVQGIKGYDGAWSLIDPQSHTNSTNTRVYWDHGNVEIDRFDEQHSGACKTNWVCNRLGLRELEVEYPPSPGGTPSPRKRGKGKARLRQDSGPDDTVARKQDIAFVLS